MTAVWHRRDLVDGFEEPLQKATAVAHGAWGGLSIIAIGPKGGKIVGYGPGGKPIYAGSKQAYSILATKHAKEAPTGAAVLEWLTQVIGVPAKLMGNPQLGFSVRVTQPTAKLLGVHFPDLAKKGHLSHDGGQFWNYPIHDLIPHLGQPLKPPTAENATHFGAKAASGEADDDPFPPLASLNEVPAGALAGSHGNRVFTSPDGRKWLFKHDKAEIARAEEAADRIARLVLGAKHAPAAKHVKLAGKSGTLVEFIPGSILNEVNHSAPPLSTLQAHFEAVVAHQVVDWLVSNHDGHAGNFLVNEHGLAAIDKGQAWKWIGEDKLDPDYSPNASKPIYRAFWNSVANGDLIGDPIAAAAKAIAQAETITPEQFEAIVAPYVAVRAKKTGVPEVDLRGKLVARLTSLRSDWEAFLTKQLGKPVILQKPSGKDNFETMPDAEPDASPVAPAQPAEPILAEKPAPGWPQTKGNVTIHHPGKPPIPETKWAKGYPGPGYTAHVTYKGEKYTVEFQDVAGKMKVVVAYPDGSTYIFDSPNDASDSLVLYSRKLAVDMTATERKKLGVSYPAAVAFGIKKFAAELAAAHTSPADTLVEKFPEAKPVVTPDSEVPIAVNEAETKPVEAPATPPPVEVPPETKEPPALKDGQYAPSYLGVDHYLSFLNVAAVGSKVHVNPPTDLVYTKLESGQWKVLGTSTPAWSATMLASGLNANGGTFHAAKAEAPAPPAKQAFQKVVNKTFTLPSGGAIAFDVVLTANPDGTFTAGVPALGFAETHPSISAAARAMFVRQKGYLSVADFKAKTGKPPPGVSWGYFGLKGAEDIPKIEALKEEAKVEFPAASLSDANWETMPITLQNVKGQPVGAKLQWSTAQGLVTATKVVNEKKWPWSNLVEGASMEIPGGGFGVPEIQALPIGTVASWFTPGQKTAATEGLVFAEKTGDNKWHVTKPGSGIDVLVDHDLYKMTPLTESITITPLPQPHQKLNLGLPADLSAHPAGHVIHYTKEGQTYRATKWESGNWKIESQSDAGTSEATWEHVSNWNSVDFAQVLATASATEAPKAEPVPETVKPSKPGKAKLITKLEHLKGLPALAVEKLKVGVEQATEWSTMLAPNGVPAGAKSGKWPFWVPPPGVFVEGQHEGKKFWMTAASIGYNKEDGTPFPQVPIAIIDEQGTAYVSQKANPSTALKESAAKAGLPTDIKKLKELFGLYGTYFAPGETLKTIVEGTGPSKLPSLPEVLDKAPEDMTAKEAAEPVKASMTLGQAIKLKLPGGSLSWNMITSKYTLTVHVQKGESSNEVMARVWKFFDELGVPMPIGAHLDPQGLMVEVDAKITDALYVVAAPKGDAASLPQASDDNWETMPEGIPKVIPATMGLNWIDGLLEKMPEGTRLVLPGGKGDVFKQGDGWLHTENPKIGPSHTMLLSAINNAGASVIPPGGSPPLVVPTPRAPPALKVVKTEDVKVKKAKELAAWAKGFKPVTDAKALLVLAHLQQLAPKTKFYARTSESGDLLLGTEKPTQLKTLWKKLTNAKVGLPVDTPIGKFQQVSVDALADALPGKPAGTIAGPDGKTYPAGTTFTSSEHAWKVYDLITSEVTKLSAHKTDPALIMVKVAGTGEEQKTKLTTVLDKYGLAHAPVAVGGQYTMAQVAKTDIYDKIAKTETIVTPVVPPQPPTFLAKPLPLYGGDTLPDWAEAAPNRADLAMLSSIKIGPTGHWIRMGAHGTFWNDQVVVRKVRDAQGKHHYEVIGQLHETLKGQLKPGSAGFRNTDSHHYAHYGYGQQKYDPETGAAIESGDSFRSYPAYVGETAAGSAISVWKEQPSLDGVFRVRIEEGKDVETELAHAFQKMGLDPGLAMREPTPDDERLFIKHQVARAVEGTSGYKMAVSLGVKDEKHLDGIIAKHGAQKLLETARVIRGFNGKQTVVVDDQAALQKAGVRFAYIGSGSSGITSTFARLREGHGFWSNRTKWLNGVEGNAASVESDLEGGGILGVFARFGNDKTTAGWGYKCDNVKVIIHPRALARTDWYAFDTDSYGKWANKSAPGRPSNFGYKSSDNEVLFEDGVSPRDIAGVVVPSESNREQLITWLKAEGVTEYNGIPVGDFVMVYTGKSRSHIAENLKGLQPGVLP